MKYVFPIFLLLILNITFINSTRAQCVSDTIAPVSACLFSIEVYLDSMGVHTIQAMDVDSNSSDNCGIATYTINDSTSLQVSCADLAAPLSTMLVVTDTAGNADTCTAFVQVQDSIRPVLDCPNAVQVIPIDNDGQAIIKPALLGIPLTEICPNPIWEINGKTEDTLDCSSIDTLIQRTVRVFDEAINMDECIVTFSVYDNIPPTPSCAPAGTVSATLDASGNASFPVALATVGSFDNCSVAEILINGQIAPTLTCSDVGVYPYTLIMTDSSGNVASCQSQINVVWNSACGFTIQADSLSSTRCDTTTCSGHVSLSTNAGGGVISYLWSDGSTAIFRDSLCAGEYHVVAEDALGNKDTIYFVIGYDVGCVWPGDTDNDAIANNYDLLPIALAYGIQGGPRGNPSINWQGQSSNNWNIPTALGSLPNYKYIDCNGDATIDSFDVRAIELNYSQSYWRESASSNGSNVNSQHPPIFVDCDTVYEGTTHCMDVNLGNLSIVADSAYAVAFAIKYDPVLVQSADITYNNSWLGAASELISVKKDFPSQGQLETSVGRIDHQPLSGNGRIGRVCFTIRDDILKRSLPDTTVMPITIDGVKLIDEDGNELPTNPVDGCLTIVEVVNNNVHLLEDESAINLYPNPTAGYVIVDGKGQALSRVFVRTITGQILTIIETEGKSNCKINLKELPEAVYIVSVETVERVINKRLLLIKG